jgi:plastocyanin
MHVRHQKHQTGGITVTRSISINDTLRRGSATAAVAALVLVVSGCGGSADKGAAAAPAAGKAPAAAGAVLEVSGAEFAFAPAKLKASAGKTTIRFSNKGVMEHDFTIDALKIKLSAAAGKTAETTVTLAPGTYNSLCTVPGHLTSGMKGTLTVS